ncbi:hypothetical protein [Bacillus sp. IT-79MI2]|uniref:hypothetical protein n=1 Tax=Bacillus sp. IT-79MI2 TaxID=3026438 RepID=UPI0039E164DE
MFEKLIGIEYKEAVPCKCTGVSYSCVTHWACLLAGSARRMKKYWDCNSGELCKTEDLGCDITCR